MGRKGSRHAYRRASAFPIYLTDYPCAHPAGIMGHCFGKRRGGGSRLFVQYAENCMDPLQGASKLAHLHMCFVRPPLLRKGEGTWNEWIMWKMGNVHGIYLKRWYAVSYVLHFEIYLTQYICAIQDKHLPQTAFALVGISLHISGSSRLWSTSPPLPIPPHP